MPPTAVGGCLQILSIWNSTRAKKVNATNGSWWMRSDPFYLELGARQKGECHQRQLVDAFRSFLFGTRRAPKRGMPPTAVGGCLQILSTNTDQRQCQ